MELNPLVHPIIKCETCGKEFQKRNKNHKYCCSNCKPALLLKEFACKQCGKISRARQINAIFCSYQCYNIYRHNHKSVKDKKRTKLIKYCTECGKEYSPLYSNVYTSKFCGFNCYKKNMAKEKKERYEKAKKKCPTCGKEFMPWSIYNIKTRNSPTYCSHKCSGIGISRSSKSVLKKWHKRKAAGKTNHLDNLWRYAVYKQGFNKCEYCDKEGKLNAHHIFSRSNFNVRWDIDNGICLCPYHHFFGTISFHKSPVEMLEWIKNKRGEEWFDRLREKARGVLKKREAIEKYGEILSGGQYDAIHRGRG